MYAPCSHPVPMRSILAYLSLHGSNKDEPDCRCVAKSPPARGLGRLRLPKGLFGGFGRRRRPKPPKSGVWGKAPGLCNSPEPHCRCVAERYPGEYITAKIRQDRRGYTMAFARHTQRLRISASDDADPDRDTVEKVADYAEARMLECWVVHRRDATIVAA